MKELPLVHIATKCASTATGDWRTFRPIIDETICKKCGLCEMYCPDGVILKIEDEFKVDYTFCKGCGICANICPFKAIKMIHEEGED
jgi:2-oxoacid:acceptor oxidoreductase delta subunit (pyruvate/2-ketoisovalerate family)